MRPAACLGAVVLLIVLVFVLVPPVTQSESYHHFADERTILGVPNFWNVVTNLAFLAAAVVGLRAFRSKTAFCERWERFAFGVAIAGAVLVTAGSSWYHWNPTNTTLVWDRLPMTLLFTAVFATIVGDRLGLDTGRRLLVPLLALGIASIAVWQASGDLRLYGIVQFLPVLAIPLLPLFRAPRYTESRWLWGMCALYGIAKVLELGDLQVGRFLTTGGHPWKHTAAAGALLCYSVWTVRRRSMQFV